MNAVPESLRPFEMPIHRRTRFPGLRHMDAAILDLHIKHNDFSPDRWFFDVPVGPVEPSIATAPWILRYPVWMRNYTNRIDLAYLIHNVMTVCEIKPVASYTALGQAIVYGHLFDQAYPDFAPVRRLIMTDWAYEPMPAICAGLKIHLSQLPLGVETPYPPMAKPRAIGDLGQVLATR